MDVIINETYFPIQIWMENIQVDYPIFLYKQSKNVLLLRGIKNLKIAYWAGIINSISKVNFVILLNILSLIIRI